MDVLFTIIFTVVLLRFALPVIGAFTDAVKSEANRIHEEGLIKTNDGAFWSPDPELQPKKH
jgi:hypothetical protein